MNPNIGAIITNGSFPPLLAHSLEQIAYIVPEIAIYPTITDFIAADTEPLVVLIVQPELTDAFYAQLNTLQVQRHAFIIIADTENEQDMRSALRHGIQDYMGLDNMDGLQLKKTIYRAADRAYYRYQGAGHHSLFYKSPTPMLIYDNHTLKILTANDAAIANYGYDRHTFLDMHIVELRPAEDIPLLHKVLDREKPNDAYYDVGVYRHKKKDGTIFYVHLYSHPIVENGVDARLVIAMDVTEKVEAQQQNITLGHTIARQKVTHETILSSLAEVVWSVRADNYELLYINDACTDVYGYTPQEMLETKGLAFDIMHPDDRESVLQANIETIERGQAEYLIRVYHKNGTLKYISGKSVYHKGTHGEPDIISGISIDVNEQKMLEQKLISEKKNLASLINNTIDMIWSVDNDLNIISANNSFCDFIFMLCGQRPEPGDPSLNSRLDKDYLQKWDQYYRNALDAPYAVVDEETINGVTVYLETYMNPLKDHTGNTLRISCFSRDITMQRNHLNRIQQQNEQLREIAWIQSHKVRGPLANIMGLVPLFDIGNNDRETNQQVINGILEASSNLDNIIRQVVQKSYDIIPESRSETY